MDRRAFTRTMRALEARYPFEDWARAMTPFEVLVSTILSQRTTVANERRGMKGLRDAFGALTPRNLAGRRAAEIEGAIVHAGLSRQKAPRIRAVAVRLARMQEPGWEALLRRPTAEARDFLTSLPGVGPKTADVVLAMAAGHPVMPVDTHVARIAGRWRLAGTHDYGSIRASLERWTPPGKRKAWHLALIAHGRTLCKARDPQCAECPVRRDCDWFRRAKARPAKRLKTADR
ncbi:MAG: endonuclease III domain-containing protein [Methanobacteriota archaeon]